MYFIQKTNRIQGLPTKKLIVIEIIKTKKSNFDNIF